MPSAAFTTLGCKVNQYETQKILESFEAKGFRIVPFDSHADVYVINSCSVTSQAESKSRYTMRKASRANPDAVLVVTGCAAQMAINRGEMLADAHVVVPNPDKLDTVRFLCEAYPDLERRAREDPAPAGLPRPAVRTRATVKIQDGCNIHCSYCSIPATRPRRMSRSWREVCDEIEGLARRGYREVVLTGVLIGNYGPETGSGGPDLPDLISRIAKIQGIDRIRISSIETTDVTPKLVETMANEPKVCRHLHIPLQSGDDGVLRAMNRPYTRGYYIGLCRDLYSAIDDLAITTDIMVGFPGEDDTAFDNTCKVVEQVGHLRGHIFRFSARPSTPAERLRNVVIDSTKDERSRTLIHLCRQTGATFAAKHIGRRVRVLVEGKKKGDGLMAGLTSNYLEVRFAGSADLVNQFVTVRLTETSPDGVFGELATDAQDTASDGLRLRVCG